MFGSMVPAWGLLVFSFVLCGPSGLPNFDSPGGVSQLFQLCFYLFFFGSPYRICAQPIMHNFNRLCEIGPAAEVVNLVQPLRRRSGRTGVWRPSWVGVIGPVLKQFFQ